MTMLCAIRQSLRVLAGVLFVLILLSVHSAQAQKTYNTSNVQGTYAYVNVTGNVGGAGLITFDGNGKVAMAIKVNVPSGKGGRKVVPVKGSGTYTVEASGIGVATIKFKGAGGKVRILNYDFVITQVSLGRMGARVLATEIFSILRSGGLKGQLVTPTWKRRD